MIIKESGQDHVRPVVNIIDMAQHGLEVALQSVDRPWKSVIINERVMSIAKWKSVYSMNSTLHWKLNYGPCRATLVDEYQLSGTVCSLQKYDIEGNRSACIICLKPLPGTCMVNLMLRQEKSSGGKKADDEK